MKQTLIFVLIAAAAQNVFADPIEKDIGNFFKDPLKQLQKSQIIKVPERPFNRELPQQNRPKSGEFWLGIVGDSSTTGAAASPRFQATWGNLFNHLFEAIKNIKSDDLNPSENLPTPMRVMYTHEEFDKAGREGTALQLNIESDLSQKVDTEEYSFGYIIGRRLNLPADHIVLSGQDGTRVVAFSTQMRRLLLAGPGTLPPVVLASYVANDLCGVENFSNPIEAFGIAYQAQLTTQFNAIQDLPPAPGGTNIMILAPLDVVNVLSDERLLSQKIPFEGRGDITCKDLREGNVGGGDFAKQMQQTLVGECRAILERSNNPAQRMATLRALQEAQNAALQEEIARFNLKTISIKMTYMPSSKFLDMQPGDLANDCFHPSRQGANRLADQLLNNELRGLTAR